MASSRIDGFTCGVQSDERYGPLTPLNQFCRESWGSARWFSSAREESQWLNGAMIGFTGGMTLRLLDVVLQPDSSHLKQRTSAGGT